MSGRTLGVNSPHPSFFASASSQAAHDQASVHVTTHLPNAPSPRAPRVHEPTGHLSRPREATGTVCLHSVGNRLLVRFPQRCGGGSTSLVPAGPSAASDPSARPQRAPPWGLSVRTRRTSPVGGEKLEHRSNPVLDADWPDPDVLRVGDDYWMIASSFHRAPGLPVLRSQDLVTWEHVTNEIGRAHV